MDDKASLLRCKAMQKYLRHDLCFRLGNYNEISRFIGTDWVSVFKQQNKQFIWDEVQLEFKLDTLEVLATTHYLYDNLTGFPRDTCMHDAVFPLTPGGLLLLEKSLMRLAAAHAEHLMEQEESRLRTAAIQRRMVEDIAFLMEKEE